MNLLSDETSPSVDVVLAMYDAITTGDLDAARRALHADVILHVPGTHPLSGSHLGPEAVIGFVLGGRHRTQDGELIDVIDVLAGRRHVGVYCTVRATRPGRRPLENRTIHLVRVQDGLVVEIWLHNFDDLAVNEFWS